MKLFEEFVIGLQNRPDRKYGGSLSLDGDVTQLGAAFDNTPLKNDILSKIEDTHIFIISMSAIFNMHGVDAQEISGDVVSERIGGLDSELDLDVAPPFQTCWFQFPEPGNGFFNGVVDKKEGFKIYGMWLHEIAPHHYLFAFVMRDQIDPRGFRFRFGTATEVQNHDIWHTICVFLQPFSKSHMVGTMKTSERIKYRHPVSGEKRLHKLRRVVFVFPKKMTAADEVEAESNSVDFSHRFSVRGHWRKIAGIGKNRQDEYCVQGFTYVCEHEKGPEHLPLTKKTRVVVAEKKEL